MRHALHRSAARLLLVLACFAGSAWAHKPSDSYLSLDIGRSEISGRWDVALRDLNFVLGLDTNADNAITWGEVKQAKDAIFALALSHLHIVADGQHCALSARDLQIDRHSDGAYAVLGFGTDCAPRTASLELEYSLFFEFDAQHRGLLNLRKDSLTRTVVFSASERRRTIDLGKPDPWSDLANYLIDGVWHIWLGYDHILFLLSLLLPAVLVHAGGHWQPAESFRRSAINVVRVVTAFTVAHSITLSLAALEVVQLPARVTESAIAASIVVAALNNVWTVVRTKHWVVAFAFGLLHGFGFANVLIDLGLPKDARVLALFGFNVGVELGQLAIVAVFLPLAYGFRTRTAYRVWVLRAGSLIIAGLGAWWFALRSLGLS